MTWRRARHNPEVSILADCGELIEILASFEHQWQHKSNWLTHLDAQPDGRFEAYPGSPACLLMFVMSTAIEKVSTWLASYILPGPFLGGFFSRSGGFRGLRELGASGKADPFAGREMDRRPAADRFNRARRDR